MANDTLKSLPGHKLRNFEHANTINHLSKSYYYQRNNEISKIKNNKLKSIYRPNFALQFFAIFELVELYYPDNCTR